jgi:hypothetical protein
VEARVSYVDPNPRTADTAGGVVRKQPKLASLRPGSVSEFRHVTYNHLALVDGNQER